MGETPEGTGSDAPVPRRKRGPGRKLVSGPGNPGSKQARAARASELAAAKAELAELRERLEEREAKNEVKVLRERVKDLEKEREGLRSAAEKQQAVGVDVGSMRAEKLLADWLADWETRE